jgi:hypothetical protein
VSGDAVALGVAPRSSSAVVVALTGPPDVLLLARTHADLVDEDLPAQAYHAASGLPLERAERLGAVAAMIYLLFNEGYSASGGDAHIREPLCEEAIRLANDGPYGLAGAVMSDDLTRCDRVAAKLRAGIIWINCSQPTFAQAPWGGYKSSGIGRELGEAGFYAYLETKQVTRFDHREDWGWYLEKGAGQ